MYLTEIIQGTETLSVFEKLAPILWGGTFTWKDLLEFIGVVFGTPIAVFTTIQFLKNNLMRLSAPYREYKTVIDGIYGTSVRKNVSKYYIPTRCQDKDPCNEEEIYEFNGKYVTEKLIPFFCNKAFVSESFGKYYIYWRIREWEKRLS